MTILLESLPRCAVFKLYVSYDLVMYTVYQYKWIISRIKSMEQVVNRVRRFWYWVLILGRIHLGEESETLQHFRPGIVGWILQISS